MNNSKTNIGISAGLIGAALYLTLLFGGYTPFLFLAAYVFLKEDNAWLKKIAVKSFTLSICLSLLAEAVGLIPDAISLVDRLFSIFKGSFSIPFISSLISFVTSALYFIKTIVFIVLGLQAVKMLDIPIPFADKIAESAVTAADNAVAAKKEEKTVKAEEAEENSVNLTK